MQICEGVSSAAIGEDTLRELRRQSTGAFVFASERGGPMTRFNLSKMVEAAGERAAGVLLAFSTGMRRGEIWPYGCAPEEISRPKSREPTPTPQNSFGCRGADFVHNLLGNLTTLSDELIASSMAIRKSSSNSVTGVAAFRSSSSLSYRSLASAS
jgi:hypothetical protein